MGELNWSALLNNIDLGNCILVLGPDAATDKVGNEFKPLTEILSNLFSDEIEKERIVLNRNDLAYTADLYTKIQSGSETDLKLKTAEFYENRKVVSNGIYTNLVNIPFRLVINATPDKLLINALENAGKKNAVGYYDHTGVTLGKANWENREIPLIYYLFGRTDEPNSLVISEKNLFEFLVHVISKNPPIHKNIISEIRDPKKCFLFLGFGFRNWYLRILLYVLLHGEEQRNDEKVSRSLALEKILPDGDINFQQVCFLFREDLKIQFTDMKVDLFVSELKDKYEVFLKNKTNQLKNRTNQVDELPIADNAPIIFICHAEEDSEAALVLCRKLQEGGLNPWIDKEGLRGGNDWDKILVKKIKKADYFIVLQSKNLVAKKRGYVNKEINEALERQKEILDPTLSFIYPVKIDSCQILEELNSRQTIDLTIPDNYNKLIKVIRDDQQRIKSN